MGMVLSFLRVSEKELEDYINNSTLLEEKYLNEEENPNMIDVGKAWDGILYLLTGNGFMKADNEFHKVIFSGQLIDEEQDLGMGPAHYLTQEQVNYFNNKLGDISIDQLRKRFIPEKMTKAQIYPGTWNDGDEEFLYLQEYFEELVDFYSKATKEKQAIISILS